MTTTVNGDTGVSAVQDGVVQQVDLAENVVGNGPCFRASLAATQSFATGTPTKVVQDTIEFNPTADFANGRFTPQVAGYYQINACNQLLTNAQGTYGYLELRKNASAVARQESAYVGNVTTNYGTVSASALVFLNGTTDFIEAWVLIVATSPYTGGSAGLNNFSGSLVRAA